MKKTHSYLYILLLILVACFLEVTSLCAQTITRERRVYYLDATYSMITPSKLWNPVRKDLAKAINAIEDQTTEIYVIAFGGNNGKQLKEWHDVATNSGKQKIINGFMNFTPKKNTMTYLAKPLNDFYSNKVASDRVTYCFLMTDGRYEDPIFPNTLSQWGAKYENAKVYGFYVMLNDSAKDPKIESIIDKQSHLWKVQTADVNINLVRLQSSAIFNARNQQYFDLPIYGDASGLNFTASFPANCPYKVKKTKKMSNSLRIWVDTNSSQKLPASTIYTLNVNMSGGGKFDFLVTETVSVKCEYKPERSLQISVLQ